MMNQELNICILFLESVLIIRMEHKSINALIVVIIHNTFSEFLIVILLLQF